MGIIFQTSCIKILSNSSAHMDWRDILLLHHGTHSERQWSVEIAGLNNHTPVLTQDVSAACFNIAKWWSAPCLRCGLLLSPVTCFRNNYNEIVPFSLLSQGQEVLWTKLYQAPLRQ